MTYNPADDEQLDPEKALRKRLIARISIALVVIACLLGGLAVFDSMFALNRPAKKLASKEEAVTPAPAPLPVTPPKAEEKPAEVAAKEEVVPEGTESANAEALQGAPTRERALTTPATARNAMMKPSAAAAAPAAKETPRDVGKEVARVIPPAGERHAPASRPLTQGREVNRSYAVQMGVFSNVANAEELRAKLELNGIPAQIEARVQVGPFKSRQEAEAAQKKLAALGLNTGMLISSKGK